MNDPYEILGVARDADDEEIKKAYRRKALEHHPDRNGGSPEAAERFKAVMGAYEALKDPVRRAELDRAVAEAELDLVSIFAEAFGDATRATSAAKARPRSRANRKEQK